MKDFIRADCSDVETVRFYSQVCIKIRLVIENEKLSCIEKIGLLMMLRRKVEESMNDK